MRKLPGLMGLMGIMGILSIMSIMPINSIQAQSPADSAFQCFLDSIDANIDATWDNPKAKGIRFTLYGNSFFVDNEYFGDRIEGYTLPGFRLVPNLTWRLNHDISITIGASWLHFWGAHSYPAGSTYGIMPAYSDSDNTALHIVPLMQVKYEIPLGPTLTVGTLDPSSHDLPLPLYNPELEYAADPENGVELEYHTNWMTADLWVDWREFIFNKSPYQERFIAGFSGDLHLYWQDWTFYMPLHFLGRHTGGQGLAQRMPVQNVFNAAAGLGFNRPFGENVYLDVTCRAMWFHQKGDPTIPFSTGWGLYPEVHTLLWNKLLLTASYWTGHNFVPLLGQWHYSNLSSVDGNLTYDRTQVLTFRANYRWRPWRENFVLNLQGSIYHYLPEKRTQYSIGLIIGFHPTLRLK